MNRAALTMLRRSRRVQRRALAISGVAAASGGSELLRRQA
jgi:hypothetical protein